MSLDGGTPLTVRADGHHSRSRAGDSVEVCAEVEAAQLFDGQDQALEKRIGQRKYLAALD